MRENLNQWDFVLWSYGVGVVAIGLLIVWAIVTMRRAETRREQAKRK